MSYPPPLFRDRLFPLLIFLIALIPRIWGIDFGLPDLLHSDEPTVVGIATSFMDGTLNPDFFNYPTLFMYLLSGIYLLWDLLLKVLGHGGFMELYYGSPERVYLLSRYVTALFGSLTPLVIYLFLRRRSPLSALFGALFLCLSPLHMKDSHYVTTDVPMTLFATISALLFCRAAGSGRAGDFLAGGLFAGLAASTKYPGGFVLILLPAALILSGSGMRKGIQKALSTILASVAAFLLGSPYTLLDRETFLRDFLYEASHMKGGHFGYEETLATPLYHLESLYLDFPGSFLLLAISGMIILFLLRGWKREVHPLLSSIFILAFFPFVSLFEVKAERYLIPLLPFLSIMAGHFPVMLRNMLLKREMNARLVNIAISLLVLLFALPALRTSIDIASHFMLPDTRTLSREWIETNLPEGTAIAMDFAYIPQVKKGSYRLLSHEENIERIYEEGAEYLIISSYVFGRYRRARGRFRDENLFYDRVEREFTLVKRFSGLAEDHPFEMRDLNPPGSLESRGMSGPEIRIYACR